MAGVNKVILVGNLGTDPDLRYTAAGKAVCHISVATSIRWTDSDGQRQTKTSWHRVVAWGKQGEQCKQHLHKGRQVYVEGRLNTNSYQDRDGQTRYTTEVVSNSVVFLGSRETGPNVQRANLFEQDQVPASPDAESAPDERMPF